MDLTANLRLLRWLRHEVHRDLASFRSRLKDAQRQQRHIVLDLHAPADKALGQELIDLQDRVTDCQAKVAMIRWALAWAEHQTVISDLRIQATTDGKREMIMFAVRFVAAAYKERPGYRPEWEIPRLCVPAARLPDAGGLPTLSRWSSWRNAWRYGTSTKSTVMSGQGLQEIVHPTFLMSGISQSGMLLS